MFVRSVFLLALSLLSASTAFAKDWLIDVRTPEEFAAGSATGAVNIEYQNILAGVEKLGVQKQDQVFVYCRSGRRSGLALETLQGAGYSQVKNLGSLEQARSWQSQPNAEAGN